MALKFNGPGSVVQAAQQKAEAIPQTEPQKVIQQPVHRELGRKKESVNHPDHYGGKDNPYEVIKVIRAWELSFSLGNVIKYVARAGKKDPTRRLEDLHKAMWYLQEEITNEYERSSK